MGGRLARSGAPVGGLAGGLGRPTGAVGGAVGGLAGGLGRPTGRVDAPSVGGVDAPAVGAVGAVGAPAVGAVGAVGAPAIGAVGGIAGAVTPPAPPVWPIVVGVGGVVVVGGAIAASVVHSGRLDTFDANLCGKSGATPECPAIESGLKVTTGLQVAGYLVGGIALTAGVVAFAVTRSATAAVDCPNEGKAAPLMVRCGVSAGGQGAGVGCFGAF
ncbi:MAG: hypothetical protein IPM54_15530 [Polyangiaceae bacterium]|nr:hypothetical protein [Polyangiaceae bacterium]